MENSWKGNTPLSQGRLRVHWLESSFAEEDLRILGSKNWTCASTVSLYQIVSTASWVELGKVLPSDQERGSFPSTQCWWDSSGVLDPFLGSSVSVRHGHIWVSPEGAVRRGWGRWACSAPGREAQGGPSCIVGYLVQDTAKMELDFSWRWTEKGKRQLRQVAKQVISPAQGENLLN